MTSKPYHGIYNSFISKNRFKPLTGGDNKHIYISKLSLIYQVKDPRPCAQVRARVGLYNTLKKISIENHKTVDTKAITKKVNALNKSNFNKILSFVISFSIFKKTRRKKLNTLSAPQKHL